jgi:hypothetical protein
MRHLFIAAALLLAAFIVTLGAASLLENMANRPEPVTEPFLPGTAPPPKAIPEQGRSLSIVTRRG